MSTPETPYDAGRRLATEAVKRRTKAKLPPFTAVPAARTFDAYKGDAWPDFMKGWIEVMKQAKQERDRG